MSRYQIVLKLTEVTLKALNTNGMSLFIMKGVDGPSSLFQTVWHVETSLSSSNTLSWNEDYNGFITNTFPRAGFGIVTRSDTSMKTSQLAMVTPYNALKLSARGGQIDNYSISNDTGRQVYCGLSSTGPDGNNAPLCCTVLYGQGKVALKPGNKLYLCFARSELAVGDLWNDDQSFCYSGGCFIDVTEPSMFRAVINYDVNKGWSCPNTAQAAHCKPVASSDTFRMEWSLWAKIASKPDDGGIVGKKRKAEGSPVDD